MLLADGQGDVERTAQLVALAHPLKITFHRAFDVTADPYKALEEIVNLGIERILTSGQEKSALEGTPLLSKLIGEVADRIIIMPGGGITERNINRIVQETGAREIHVSGRKKLPSLMVYRNERVSMGGDLRLPEYELSVVDADKITGFRQAISLA